MIPTPPLLTDLDPLIYTIIVAAYRIGVFAKMCNSLRSQVHARNSKSMKIIHSLEETVLTLY